MATPAFHYQDPFPLAKDPTQYRNIGKEGVSVAQFDGKEILKVEPEALEKLAREAMRESPSCCARAQRAGRQDPRATRRPRRTTRASPWRSCATPRSPPSGELPICQDTGTATIIGKKGQQVWTGVKDEEWLSKGVYKTYTEGEPALLARPWRSTCTRRSTPAPTCRRRSTSSPPTAMDYKFLFIAKGGGSANKTMPLPGDQGAAHPGRRCEKFLVDKMKYLGTAACPPYHIAFVIGGTSADACLKTVKLASAQYLDEPADRRATSTARPSATWSWRRSCSRRPTSSASAPSSAASTSPTTSASSACRATAPPARSAWRSPARPTATSRRRSPRTGSSSRNSTATRAVSSPSSTAASTSTA